MVCDENDCHYKMSGNPAGTVTYRKATLWFCMHSLCALLFGEIALRNYLSLITCWQAVLNSDKACFTNEIRAAFQPFNILNVHYQEKAENLFLSSQLQTSTGIRILTCKALSPLQIQKLLFHAICLLVFLFVSMFSLSSSPCCFVSAYFAPWREREMEEKDLLSCCSLSSIYEMWTLMPGWSTFCCICTLHDSAPFCLWHRLIIRPLLPSPARICPEPKHSGYIFAQISGFLHSLNKNAHIKVKLAY